MRISDRFRYMVIGPILGILSVSPFWYFHARDVFSCLKTYRVVLSRYGDYNNDGIVSGDEENKFLKDFSRANGLIFNPNSPREESHLSDLHYGESYVHLLG